MEYTQCQYCQKTYSRPSSLTRHYTTCKVKKTQEQTLVQTEHSAQLVQLKEMYELQIQQLRAHYETQLKAQSERIEKLENQIFEIAKQPKTNNNHHNTVLTKTTSKTNVTIVNQLAPFNIESDKINELIQEHFTVEVFQDGPRAIAKLAAELLLTDPDTRKPRLICTDLDRRNFKYLDPTTGEVLVDPGFQKTHELIRRPLSDANWRIWVERYKRSKWMEETCTVNDRFIADRKQLSGLLLPVLASASDIGTP